MESKPWVQHLIIPIMSMGINNGPLACLKPGFCNGYGRINNNEYYGDLWAGNSKKILNFGSREVRGPLLNKRGSCRTLGVSEKNDVRPSVSRSVVLTINQPAIARDWTIDRCRRLSVFFTANICTNPDVHTWHILVILYSYCACQLSSMESTQSVPE